METQEGRFEAEVRHYDYKDEAFDYDALGVAQDFIGLTPTNSRHRDLLLGYAKDELMAYVHTFIKEQIAIYEDRAESAEQRVKAESELDDALMWISKSYLIYFLNDELERLGVDNFYRIYGISETHYLD